MSTEPESDEHAADPGPALTVRGADLDIFGIGAFREEALAWAGAVRGPELRLDLAEAGDLDLSGLQVLLALDRTLRGKGCRLALTGLRPDWNERLARLGLAQLLEGRP